MQEIQVEKQISMPQQKGVSLNSS